MPITSVLVLPNVFASTTPAVPQDDDYEDAADHDDEEEVLTDQEEADNQEFDIADDAVISPDDEEAERQLFGSNEFHAQEPLQLPSQHPPTVSAVRQYSGKSVGSRKTETSQLSHASFFSVLSLPRRSGSAASAASAASTERASVSSDQKCVESHKRSFSPEASVLKSSNDFSVAIMRIPSSRPIAQASRPAKKQRRVQ